MELTKGSRWSSLLRSVVLGCLDRHSDAKWRGQEQGAQLVTKMINPMMAVVLVAVDQVQSYTVVEL